MALTAGLSTRPFRGLHSIPEVTCTGSPLPPDTHVFALALFSLPGHRKLAYVNVASEECSTTDVYTACVIDRQDSRRSRLVALVCDLQEGDWRLYGCNVTGFRSGDTFVTSWSLRVHYPSRCIIP